MALLLVLLIATGFSTVTPRHVNFYRKDYTYFDEFNAFYKLHWDNNGNSWDSAFQACEKEGAELFYPKVDDEWTVVKKLVETMPTAPNVSDVFVGIHDQFGVGEFNTINGYPTSTPILNSESLENERRCVTLDLESGALEANDCYTEYDIRPFVCKKVEDTSCPTIDKGYKYFIETRKCYKLNENAMTWSEAMKTCFLEGGLLLVIESGFEADVLHRKVIPHDNNYYVGFKKLFGQDYYTVKGFALFHTLYGGFGHLILLDLIPWDDPAKIFYVLYRHK